MNPTHHESLILRICEILNLENTIALSARRHVEQPGVSEHPELATFLMIAATRSEKRIDSLLNILTEEGIDQSELETQSSSLRAYDPASASPIHPLSEIVRDLALYSGNASMAYRILLTLGAAVGNEPSQRVSSRALGDCKKLTAGLDSLLPSMLLEDLLEDAPVPYPQNALDALKSKNSKRAGLSVVNFSGTSRKGLKRGRTSAGEMKSTVGLSA